jgi:hypothetical protein
MTLFVFCYLVVFPLDVMTLGTMQKCGDKAEGFRRSQKESCWSKQCLCFELVLNGAQQELQWLLSDQLIQLLSSNLPFLEDDEPLES